MGDPFEEAAQTTLGAGSPSLREPSVRQAVAFLNDPRVKEADPSKAVSFLRDKGITDEELREAYRRCGLPFPASPTPRAGLPPFPYDQPSGSFFPPHGGPLVPFQLPPPQRPSWVSVFLGITAAAGLYAAVRELLKRYVVPMYFPDAVRVAEERRRRDELTMVTQERQISELRERVQELLESSRRTNENMEDISASLSSSMALREKEISQNSELRDAIRHLSHSATASGGTEASVGTKGGHEEDNRSTVYPPFLNGKQAQKQGSLAYGHVSSFDGSLTPHVEESHSRQFTSPLARKDAELSSLPRARKSTSKVTQKSPVSAQDSNSAAELKTTKNEDDDFMAIAPAEVEESWSAGLSKRSDRADFTGSEELLSSNVPGQAYSKPDEDILPESAQENVDYKHSNDAKNETGAPSEEIQAVADSNGLGSNNLDVGHEEVAEFQESVAKSARQLFQDDLMNEANLVLGKSPTSRARPMSMPQMDVPLSDGEV